MDQVVDNKVDNKLILRISKARPIKPMVVRVSVELYDANKNIMGEYDIALDIEGDVRQDEENPSKVNVNVAALQQKLTDAVADMQLTGMIANQFEGLEWIAVQPE